MEKKEPNRNVPARARLLRAVMVKSNMEGIYTGCSRFDVETILEPVQR